MIRKIGISGLIAAAALAIAPVGASANDIVTFVGNGGNLGTSHNFADADALTTVNAQGFYLDGGSWTAANLFQRNESNDMGIGVCNPNESAHCTAPGNGDWNELSNLHGQELIQLTLPTPNFEWVAANLSSLDTGGTDGGERGVIFAADSALASDLSLASLLDGSASGTSIVEEFMTDGGSSYGPIDLSGVATSPYLYFIAFDWSAYNDCIQNSGSSSDCVDTAEGSSYNNNDYLLQDVAIAYPAPEPATLSLLGLGLVGLGWARRRTAKARG